LTYETKRRKEWKWKLKTKAKKKTMKSKTRQLKMQNDRIKLQAFQDSKNSIALPCYATWAHREIEKNISANNSCGQNKRQAENMHSRLKAPTRSAMSNFSIFAFLSQNKKRTRTETQPTYFCISYIATSMPLKKQ
jgi:hypothetical protein